MSFGLSLNMLNSLWPSDAIGSCKTQVVLGSGKIASHARHQVMTWTNDDFSILALETKFSGIWYKIRKFSLKKMIWKCCLQNDSHFNWASMC